MTGLDGRRLAKRHGDTRLSYYRKAGVAPQRIVAMLARWSGIADVPDEIDAAELMGRFELSRVPREPVRFGAAEDAWLLDATLNKERH